MDILWSSSSGGGAGKSGSKISDCTVGFNKFDSLALFFLSAVGISNGFLSKLRPLPKMEI